MYLLIKIIKYILKDIKIDIRNYRLNYEMSNCILVLM